MRRRAELHEALVMIEKEDKIMKRRLNVGTGRKNRKEIIGRMMESEAGTITTEQIEKMTRLSKGSTSWFTEILN